MVTTLRLRDDGPFWYRDADVSLRRGTAVTVSDEVAARLLDTTACFEQACGTLMESGTYCPRPVDTCRYHAATPPDTDADAAEAGAVDGAGQPPTPTAATPAVEDDEATPAAEEE